MFCPFSDWVEWFFDIGFHELSVYFRWPTFHRASLTAQTLKNLPAMQEIWV